MTDIYVYIERNPRGGWLVYSKHKHGIEQLQTARLTRRGALWSARRIRRNIERGPGRHYV